MAGDAFGARSTLDVGGESYEIFRLAPLQERFDVERLPYTLKILLENVLRTSTEEHVQAVAEWVAKDDPSREISFTPGRVIHQDFTGVPAIVDLAAMRHAMHDLGGDAAKTNPQLPAELVIDHSVQVDAFANRMAMRVNTDREYERNGERYAFLRWGQQAFDDLKVVPPETGIVHQVNLEYLGRVVEARNGQAFPDTLLGTDSHTTMINGLGVLGWGVGGIEAEAAMLGESVSMLVPQVVGFRLTGSLREGATATDLVLTVTQILRQTGVVGKFVEYFGAGVSNLPLADRATIGNMSPEYGATCGFFPVDEVTLEYLRLTGPPDGANRARRGLLQGEPALARPRARADLLRRWSSSISATSSPASPGRGGRRIEFRSRTRSAPSWPRSRASASTTGTRTTRPSPSRSPPAIRPPTSRRAMSRSPSPSPTSVPDVVVAERAQAVPVELDGEQFELEHGAVVIAAITSCTNTSNPSVMVAAGLVAKKAVERGLERKPWVKSSLAPGSKVVTEYYERAGLTPYLEQLGFYTVGYGCTTCIGNSGPLPEPISKAVAEGDLVVCSVLSGNRNFEARIHPEVKANYLASPPLVVAYALAGRMDIDLTTEPLGQGSDGEDVYLRTSGRAPRRSMPP